MEKRVFSIFRSICNYRHVAPVDETWKRVKNQLQLHRSTANVSQEDARRNQNHDWSEFFRTNATWLASESHPLYRDVSGYRWLAVECMFAELWKICKTNIYFCDSTEKWNLYFFRVCKWWWPGCHAVCDMGTGEWVGCWTYQIELNAHILEFSSISMNVSAAPQLPPSANIVESCWPINDFVYCQRRIFDYTSCIHGFLCLVDSWYRVFCLNAPNIRKLFSYSIVGNMVRIW